MSDPRAVPCPSCGAPAGRYCRRPSGHSGPFVAPHKARREAAATALPPGDIMDAFERIKRDEWSVVCMSAGGREGFSETWRGAFRGHTITVRFSERSIYNDTFATNSGERMRTGGRRKNARYLDAEVEGMATARDLFDLARWIVRDKPDPRPVRARFRQTRKTYGQLVFSVDDAFDLGAYLDAPAEPQAAAVAENQLTLGL